MASTQAVPKPQALDHARPNSLAPRVQAVDVKEELVECIACYARQNPGRAALVCLGVGFVLGWKLKTW